MRPCWGGGGGGMHVPRINFKSCHVEISEGPYVAVGISSTATPEIRRTSYAYMNVWPHGSFETLVCPIRPTLGRFSL